ncbi:MAG: UDP-N-acetylglucosamine 4,6-dehydratase (inverting) [Pseudomonadota bacterium]
MGIERPLTPMTTTTGSALQPAVDGWDPAQANIFNNASILITGATGSFGKNFIKTLFERYQPRRVAVFSRDELKQYEMQNDPAFQREELRFFIGDVRDERRLDLALRGVDYVIHAAALKHVTAAEYNPFECIRTNVLGAENIVHAAIQQGVKKVIALSTDKAASPINLYGASKLASDKIFVAANNLSGAEGTKFAVVRYGNVVGSRGSVVPFFQKLIAEGAESLPITDERMTRFWITLQQGVDFVMSSMAMMNGGEVFVPKIPSMRVPDLAKALAPDVPTHVIGIRPGEKLHEVMVPVDDARSTIELADRYVIEPVFAWWDRVSYLAQGARTVPEDFTYSSDKNDDWLSAAALRAMLGLDTETAA